MISIFKIINTLKLSILICFLTPPLSFSEDKRFDSLLIKERPGDLLQEKIKVDVTLRMKNSYRAEDVLNNKNTFISEGEPLFDRDNSFSSELSYVEFPLTLFIFESDGSIYRVYPKMIVAKYDHYEDDFTMVEGTDGNLEPQKNYVVTYSLRFDHKFKSDQKKRDFLYYVGFDPFLDAKVQLTDMPYGDRPHFKYTRVEQNFHSLVGEELSTKDIIPDPKHSAEPIENVSLFLLDFSYKGDRLYQSNAELEFEIVHNNSWKIDKYDPPSAFKHLFSNSGERK